MNSLSSFQCSIHPLQKNDRKILAKTLKQTNRGEKQVSKFSLFPGESFIQIPSLEREFYKIPEEIMEQKFLKTKYKRKAINKKNKNVEDL